MTKILAFAGSSRTGSLNRQLIVVAAHGAREAGADVTLIDLRDYALPLYDGDLEAESGLPEGVKKLKELFLQHQGLLIAAPEYNGSITPLLKNTIDWVSRPAENEAPLACFDGKVAVLMAASPGGLGGLRGLAQVRAILSGIRVLVLPQQLAVPKAHDAFDGNGGMRDKKQQAAVENLGAKLVEVAGKLH